MGDTSRLALRDETGASAVEYALIMVLIAMAIVGAVILFGTATSGLFEEPCEEMAAAGNPCP